MNKEQEEENKIDNKKKKIASKIIKKDTDTQIDAFRAEVCNHKLKLTILNIFIFIIFGIIITRFIINPYCIKKKNIQKDVLSFHNVLIKNYYKYTNTDNILLLVLFIIIIIIFLSFNIIELQNIGIILLITFITAIAQEGGQFLTGALLSGITAYLFIRLKTYFNTKNHKLDQCNDDIITIIKNKFK